MDKIIEKLGIYDLLVLLLTGMIILLFSLNLLPFFNLEIKIDDTLQFLIVSYFIGMLFQEIGYIFNENFIEMGMLKKVFNNVQSSNYHISLSQKEVDFIKKKVCKKLHKDISDLSYTDIYVYCKTDYLKTSNDKNEIEQQALKASMARSLFLFFIITLICLCKIYLSCYDDMMLGLLFLNVISILVFLNRYIRFYMRRYVHILRTFYYKNK